jgi:ribosome-associated protein
MSSDEQDVSKSERKRQAKHLQNLGARLAELSADALEGLELPPRLAQAIADYQRFPSFGARRRQLQFIGRLMRDADADAIEASLAEQEGTSAAARYEFHQLERWRERLLTEPDALTEYFDEHPSADRQRLRRQLKRVHDAHDEQAHRTESRALFRLLREFA